MLALPSFADAVIIDYFVVIDMPDLTEWSKVFHDESWRCLGPLNSSAGLPSPPPTADDEMVPPPPPDGDGDGDLPPPLADADGYPELI